MLKEQDPKIMIKTYLLIIHICILITKTFLQIKEEKNILGIIIIIIIFCVCVCISALLLMSDQMVCKPKSIKCLTSYQ